MGAAKPPVLSYEDKGIIQEVFYETIVPRLRSMDARTGVLSCGFAGSEYKSWTITFVSRGDGFGITEFEFDPDAEEVSLDLDAGSV